MADAGTIAAEEFALWLTVLQEAINSIKVDLAAENVDLDDLRNHHDDLIIAQTALEGFRPTGKKACSYEFKLAIVPLIESRRLMPKIARILTSDSAVQQPQPQPTSHRKAPELKIRPFTGDITAFNNFIVAFETKFGDANITDSERLMHLQSLVQGGPGKLIASYAITDDNYSRAIDELKSAYDKKEEVISALYEKIKRIQQCTGNTSSLSSNYYELAGILAALKSHGHDVDSFLPLRDEIAKKYPFYVIQAVSKNRKLPVTELQSEILQYIQLKETAESANTSTKSSAGNHSVGAALTASSNDRRRKDSAGKEKGSATESSTALRKPKYPCVFCGQQTHFSSQCPTHTTYEIRTELVKNRCLLCLQPSHRIAACTRTLRCHYCKEENSHNSAICPVQFKKNEVVENATATNSAQKTEESKASYFIRAHKGAHVTTLVSVENPETKQTFKLRALLDSGSNETYISEEAARRCGLQLSNKRIVPVTVFLRDQPVKLHTATTHFILTNESDFRVSVIADTSTSLPQEVHLFDYAEFRQIYPQYEHLDYVDQAPEKQIEILIGGDYVYDILREKSAIENGLHLQLTAFGWTLVGRQNGEDRHRSTYFHLSPAAAIAQLSELESVGIHEMPLSVVEEEEKALTQFYANIRTVDNRYEIRWPWRRYPPQLTSNLGLAAGRLKTTQRKLTKEMFENYNEILNNQIESGIVAEIAQEDIERARHFLPHQVVLTPEKSTAMRIVYDGSAKTKSGKSINDEIFKGRNMLADNTKIIIRWRLYAIVTVSDLEKAFHQLRIHPDDSYYVCFLWLKDLEKPASGKNLRFLRFLRVVFGITASPFLLLATIRFHLQKYENKYPNVVKKLQSDSFADNFASGFDSEEEAKEFYARAVSIFEDCKMNLRKWASNSSALREKFVQPDKAEAISVLGILWNQYEDIIKIKSLEFASVDTLRTILATVAQFYDPVGYFSPIIVTAKIFLREIHPSYEWDELVSDEHREKWHQIRSSLAGATKRNFPRFQAAISNETAKYSLHLFTDASIKACACAVYLRKETDESITSNLILSKTKLAKIENIPKLELLAVTIGVKALNYVREAIQKPLSAYLWCDSKCTLSWLSTQRILPAYIERQVAIINAIPKLDKRYVPSVLNIADLPSRGCTIENLPPEWFQGPDWLNSSSENWPQKITIPTSLENPFPADEVPKTTAVTSTAEKLLLNLHPDKFNSVLPILRITCYVLKFLSKFEVIQRRNLFQNPSIFEAQRLWIKNEQNNHLYDIKEAIEMKKHHPIVSKFNLYIDSRDIVRCAGRLQKAPLSTNEKRPIFLPSPKCSRFVRLLIEHYHEASFHSGIQSVLTSFRRRFWVPAGRRIFYNIIKNCNKCKRYTTQSYSQPAISELPPFRLEETIPPFTNIGIDVLGPLFAENEKRWVLLTTDLVIRAIDLELLEDMSAEKTFLALRTIIARRSTPKLIVSDQAPQFKAIRDLFERFYVHEWTWKFLPAYSPWMGGVYERMVHLVKEAIRRSFHGTQMTDYVLRTSLAEISAVLNSRPISAVTDSSDDIEPLSPRLFLHSYHYESEELNLEKNASKLSPTANQLVRIAKCARANLDRFWANWRTLYLQHLRSQGYYRNKLFRQKTSMTPPKLNAIVLVAEKHLKRNRWALGRIVQLLKSADGKIRAVKLKAKDGIIIRPLNVLYPMEIVNDELTETSDEILDENTPAENPVADEWDEFSVEVQEFDSDVEDITSLA